MRAMRDLNIAKDIQQREMKKEREKSNGGSQSSDEAQKCQEIDKTLQRIQDSLSDFRTNYDFTDYPLPYTETVKRDLTKCTFFRRIQETEEENLQEVLTAKYKKPSFQIMYQNSMLSLYGNCPKM